MAPIEGSRPMKLVARIELAAAALATACSHAYDSAHGAGSPERASKLYEKAEELVVRRARSMHRDRRHRFDPRRRGVSARLKPIVPAPGTYRFGSFGTSSVSSEFIM